jgi:AsmA protein
MKKLLVGVGVVVLLLVVAALVAPFLIPTDVYKDRLIAQVKASTGRDLTITGPMRLSLLPRLELEAENVAFANAPGAAEKQMAQLKKLSVQLALLPLLSGEVAVDRFVLSAPVIHLELDKRGQPNWVFAQAEAGAAPATAPQATARPDQTGGSTTRIEELRLGEVKIEDGLVTYLDQRTGTRHEARDVDVALKLPSLAAPVSLEGALTWNEKRLRLAAHADRARALLDRTPTPVGLKLTGEPITLSLTGTAALPKITGDVDLEIPSVRAFAAWAGQKLDAPENALGPLALTGKVAAENGRFAFTDAKLSLDEVKGSGEVRLDTSGARPNLAAKLALEKLDLNPYLGAETAPKAATPPAAAPAAPPAGGTGSAPAPAAPAASDWSDAPIDLAALKALDAALDLTASEIRYRKVTVDKGVLGVTLKDGRLAAALKDLELYNGKGTGEVTVAERGGAAALDLAFRLAGVNAENLLKDLAQFDKIAGTGNIELKAAGAGKSQREIVAALDGNGAVAFTNGALKGVDLAKIARNIGGDSSGATEFSELKGTFVIRDGIVRNDDLLLVSPLLRIEGAGTVDLPKRTLAYRLAPKGDLAQLGIGILVEGAWTHPSYKADLGNLPGRLLQGLERRDAPPSGDAPASGGQKPADILRGILGGQRR